MEPYKVQTAIPVLLKILKEGADIISGLEAYLDNADIDAEEARLWWSKADDIIAKIESEVKL